MSIWSRIKGFIGGESNTFPSTEGGFYPLMNTSFAVTQLTRSDYIRLYTSWQYVAVSTIANAVAELEISLTRGNNGDQVNHPHRDLITYDMLLQMVSSLQLTGSAYFKKNMVGNRIESLDFMRTDYVEIEEEIDGSIRGYRYNIKNKNYLFRPEEVLDISLYSPLKTYPYTVKGVSPMQAVAIQAEMDTTANRWNWNFFKNGASVGDILKTDQKIDGENKKRIADKWKNNFQGVNNAHKVAVLDSGLEYQQVKITQKELDFVESRRFTRDEVLAIFKVPKVIIGITDDVNRASAVVAESTFYRICIRPLTKQIEESLQRELFDGIGEFSFVNVVPADTEQMLLDLNAGAITINEYREQRGYEPLVDGDVLKVGNMIQPVEIQEEKKVDHELRNIINKALAKHTKGTPEYHEAREQYGQKLWEEKIVRTDNFEIQYAKQVRELFSEQKSSIVEQVLSQKNKKTIQKPLFGSSVSNVTKWTIALAPIYRDVFQSEGNEAINMIGITGMFETGSDNINRWIRDNIALVAKEVDKVTKEKVFEIIEEGNRQGLGAQDIAMAIDQQFQEFNQKRAETIARTEITRASNEAYIEAYEQSGIKKKERFTAMDERVCPECNALHGTVKEIREDFFEATFGTGQAAPLHPNCRCTLLPVIE